MPIVDAGTLYKHGAYLSDKTNLSTIAAFDVFQAKAELMTGRKIRKLRTDRAFDSHTWEEYCQEHNILHEFMAPYSSAQNGLAERAIRTMMDNVRTLLRDAGLSHSFWAEAAAYSVDTRNVVPSRRHPGRIPLEAFSGKHQDILHLCVFGSRCWAKIPMVHGVQVTGGSKLDSRGVECRLLGYTTGQRNYKVQETASLRVFVSCDVVFEEGWAHHTLLHVGEDTSTFHVFGNNRDDTHLFNMLSDNGGRADAGTAENAGPTNAHSTNNPNNHPINDDPPANAQSTDNPDNHLISKSHNDHANPAALAPVTQMTEPRRSSRISQPSGAILKSRDYQEREITSRNEGQDWATARKHPRATFAFDRLNIELEEYIACMAETKASHHIPRSYRHAIATDPDRWMLLMQVEMDTLKQKHTWDLVKAPEGANIMDSMWVYDIKWDGEGNRIKDKARLVGKGYMQQLSVDYNKTWAGVTRLESVRMTAAIATKYDLKLWQIDFVRAYLNSLTKEDIYM